MAFLVQCLLLSFKGKTVDKQLLYLCEFVIKLTLNWSMTRFKSSNSGTPFLSMCNLSIFGLLKKYRKIVENMNFFVMITMWQRN